MLPRYDDGDSRPFFDDYEKASLWGKDLYEHLDWVDQKAARFCVLFASEAYAAKVCATHERQKRAGQGPTGKPGVHPAGQVRRHRDSGLRPTVMYIDATTTTPAAPASLIGEKLGPRVRTELLPARA